MPLGITRYGDCSSANRGALFAVERRGSYDYAHCKKKTAEGLAIGGASRCGSLDPPRYAEALGRRRPAERLSSRAEERQKVPPLGGSPADDHGLTPVDIPASPLVIAGASIPATLLPECYESVRPLQVAWERSEGEPAEHAVPRDDCS